jgi:hypothetical protein
MNAKQALRTTRAPDEGGAENRGWTVVRSAYAERPVAAHKRSQKRLAVLVPAAALTVLTLAFTPAGASVRHWLNDALGVRHPAPALFSLPAPGRLLVSGPAGSWTVAGDGSARRLGPWRQASWSPHGLFAAVAGANQLAAVDPRGTIKWALARPAVSDPQWYLPTGFRVAYRSGSELRVVAGDGTGDHLVAAHTAPVAPAWRPGHPYELSYIDAAGRLITRDADTAQTIWTARAPRNVRALTWSPDGSRLLVVTRTATRVYDHNGTIVATTSAQPGAPILDAAISPDGRTLALVRGGSAEDVVVVATAGAAAHERRVLSGDGLEQVAWSPDGRWLLVSWPRADQWVFVRVAGKPRIAAVSRIAQQFAPRMKAPGFPRIQGWCCAAGGSAG